MTQTKARPTSRFRSGWRQNIFCFLIAGIFLQAALSGCALLPQRTAPEESEQEVVAEPQPEPFQDQTPEVRKSWRDYVFFWWPRRKDAPPSALALTPIGRIYMINEPGKFVIIESPMAAALPEGKILSTLLGGEVTSTIEVAAERKTPFAIGVILSGKPSQGDNLFVVK